MKNIGEYVIYQIYPKSFKDTTGSGQGDLRGIINSLGYLEELGIDFIWLTPIYPSPQNDNGYDVADYCSINKDFGTMEDFEELVEESKKRNPSCIRRCSGGASFPFGEGKAGRRRGAHRFRTRYEQRPQSCLTRYRGRART